MSGICVTYVRYMGGVYNLCIKIDFRMVIPYEGLHINLFKTFKYRGSKVVFSRETNLLKNDIAYYSKKMYYYTKHVWAI